MSRRLLPLLLLLVLVSPLPAQEPKKTTTFTLRYHLQPVLGEPVVKFTCLVPKTLPLRQNVVRQKFSHMPAESIDENGAR